MKLRLAAPGDDLPPTSPHAVTQSWHYPDGSVAVVCEEADGELRVAIPDVGVIRARHGTSDVVGYPDRAGSAEQLRAAFRDEVVPRLFAARGACALHASAVATGRSAIALLGESHAGKSSLAFAWAVRRRRVLLADDALALEEAAGGYRVQPLEFEANLRAPVGEVVHGSPERYGAQHGEIDLGALVVVSPETAHAARPSLDRLAAREAFPLVIGRAYGFHLQSDDARRRFFGAYLRLLRAVPAYRLGYPHELAALDPTIDLLEPLLAGAQSHAEP